VTASANGSDMISLTIPIYNEAASIPTLIARVTASLSSLGQPWELILVNDGSTDESATLLDEAAEKNPFVKVIHFRRNFGQTAAMMAGFNFASGDIIIPMDGDLQNDPDDIPLLLAELDRGFDVCSGWRRNRQDNHLARTLPSILANRLISAISGVRLHDYGCTLKAYRANVLKGVKLYGEMHRFVPIYASWQGAKVTEIPVQHHPRKFGKSNYGLERTVKVVLDLIVVKFLSRYAQKPMYVFGGFGVLSLLLGFIAAVVAMYLKFFRDISLIQTPLLLMSLTAGMVGVMCILMGLLAELITRTYHESQDKPVYLIRATKNIDVSNHRQ
jgi:glycosyltransferase involved in cell wall biosynthesis